MAITKERLYYSALLVLALGSGRAFAFSNHLDEFYRGVRASAMGDAYTCVSDDLDGVFYNPAGLAQSGTSDVTLLRPKIDVSTDDAKLISPIRQTIGSGLDAKTIQSLFGNDIYASGTNFSAIRFPGFVFGYYYGASVHLLANNAAYPQVDLTYLRDQGVVTGYGYESQISKRQFLRFGLSVKWLQRVGFEGTVPLSSLAAANKTTLSSLEAGPATGWGASPGLQYEARMTRQDDLILGVVWQDIGDTSFGNSSLGDPPPPIRNDLAAGVELRHRFSVSPYNKTNFKFTFEMRHLWEKDVDPRLKLHVGAELQTALWMFPLSIEAGLNQDSLTFGVGVHVWVLDVDAAYYGVENDSLAYLDREQRIVLQATLRFDTLGTSINTKREEDQKKHPRTY